MPGPVRSVLQQNPDPGPWQPSYRASEATSTKAIAPGFCVAKPPTKPPPKAVSTSATNTPSTTYPAILGGWVMPWFGGNKVELLRKGGVLTKV